MTDKLYIISGCIAGLAIIGFILYRIKKVIDWFNSVISDTLKRYDKREGKLKWSMTKIFMVTAFDICIVTYCYDCYINGFNEIAFYGLLVFATTGKVADSWSKKINPDEPSR